MANQTRASLTLVGIFLLSFALAGFALWRTDVDSAWAGSSFPTLEIDGELFYIVRSGDTLILLADAFGVTVEDFIEANEGLDPSQIRVGQRLRIPESSDVRMPPAFMELIPSVGVGEEAADEEAADVVDTDEPDAETLRADEYYVVVRGDSLRRIERLTGVPAEDIARYNNVPLRGPLYRGQRLRLTPPPQMPAAQADPEPAPAPQPQRYTIQRGDSLARIARLFGVSAQDIAEANNLPLRGPLYRGHVITIPAPGAAASPDMQEPTLEEPIEEDLIEEEPAEVEIEEAAEPEEEPDAIDLDVPEAVLPTEEGADISDIDAPDADEADEADMEPAPADGEMDVEDEADNGELENGELDNGEGDGSDVSAEAKGADPDLQENGMAGVDDETELDEEAATDEAVEDEVIDEEIDEDMADENVLHDLDVDETDVDDLDVDEAVEDELGFQLSPALELWQNTDERIRVFSPAPDFAYHSQLEIIGLSQTFEGNVEIQLKGASGEVLAERYATGGSIDGHDFFRTHLRFTVQEPTPAKLIVFERSMEDGSIMAEVEIPLTLLPGQRFIDIYQPEVGASLCQTVLVAGYSNTFEANVSLELAGRDGELLDEGYATGGAYGIYREFFHVFDYSSDEAAPLLLTAYELDASDRFDRIDPITVPVSYFPGGDPACE